MVLNIGSIFTPSVTCPPARAKCGNSKAKTVAIAYFIFVLPNKLAPEFNRSANKITSVYDAS